MTQTVLILGGTREAVAIAKGLTGQHPGWRIITSLAGRTAEPAPVTGETRIGGFGGVAGLADYLRDEGITRLIDATHPYARRISANATEAAALAGVPLDVRTRPPWTRRQGDDWQEVASEADAAAAIPNGARVFLALGRQHLAPFEARDDVFFIVRMVDSPAAPLPMANHAVIVGKPGDSMAEAQMLRAHAVTCIVCRNSGGDGAYGKIEAARALGIPVIMIARPD
ncbi:MAG: cobalt-precorrin-6A reductase [Roseitalea sp.]|nr:cobalt-precorrin-6A reductase [Roseitalea sp.]MBO6721312.1 cobalt-precorrin-6A reductase [Roseitalea sp.]MBO6742203.1 cobalt-precorrin-6A reductase [Roseitalea sp.]